MLQRYEKYEGRRNKELDAIKELFGCDFAEVNEKLEKAQRDSGKTEKLERKHKRTVKSIGKLERKLK